MAAFASIGFLLPLILAFPPLAHPHVPKALVMGGASGTVKVLYFTVPWNASHLAEVGPGFEWHLGYAVLATEVPLRVGDVELPAGSYDLDARLGQEEAQWDIVLHDRELRQLERTARRAERRGDTEAAEEARQRADARRQELGRAAGGWLLPARPFDAPEDEHLTMTAVLEGYRAAARWSDEPAGGIEFVLRVGFGDLHRQVRFEEDFEAADGSRGR